MSDRIILIDIGNALTLRGVLPSIALDGSDTPYSAKLTASGGIAPYSYAIVSGSLPSGLWLDATSGVISGNADSAGRFATVVEAKDARGLTVRRSFVLRVVAEPAPPLQLTGDAPDGELSIAYSYTYAVSNGHPPYTFSIAMGALPPGITLDTATGNLSGAPTELGDYAWTIKAVDDTGAHVAIDDALHVDAANGLVRVSVVLGSASERASDYMSAERWGLVIGDFDFVNNVISASINDSMPTSFQALSDRSNDNLVVGGTGYYSNAYQTFRGRIWGAGVANGGLTDKERDILWNNGSGITFAALAARIDSAAAALWNKLLWAWQLDEPAGSTVYTDAKGDADLTKSGIVETTVDPDFGQCAVFARNGRLIGPGPALEGTRVVYFAWIYPEVKPSDSYPAVMCRYDGQNIYQGIRASYASKP